MAVGEVGSGSAALARAQSVPYPCGTVATESSTIVRIAQLARQQPVVESGLVSNGARNHRDPALEPGSSYEPTLIVRGPVPTQARRWPTVLIVLALSLATTLAVVWLRRGSDKTSRSEPVAEPLMVPEIVAEPLEDIPALTPPVRRPSAASTSRVDAGVRAPVQVGGNEAGGRRHKERSQVVGFGVLQIGSKPPCDIYVDDRAPGLSTPQRSIRRRPGRHRIGLVNTDVGIDERFTVRIRDGRTTKIIRDMSDRL